MRFELCLVEVVSKLKLKLSNISGHQAILYKHNLKNNETKIKMKEKNIFHLKKKMVITYVLATEAAMI